MISSSSLNKSSFSIFELWKNTQIRLLDIKNNKLQEKKNQLPLYKSKFDEIMYDAKIKTDNTYEFSLINLVKVIKYINASNAFFNNRVPLWLMDEVLLLVYLYEWIYLKQEKNPNILGTKEEVIEKFRLLTFKSNSEYKNIFEDIDLSKSDEFALFAIRVKNATFKSYASLMNLIKNDDSYFNKIENESLTHIPSLNDSHFIKLWKETFTIEDDRVNYSYSDVDSDETFIFINVETKNEQVAFVKFRMFKTFDFVDEQIVPNGISKEILRIEFLNPKYEHIGSSILANSLKLANRVVKNIFLPNIKVINNSNGNQK